MGIRYRNIPWGAEEALRSVYFGVFPYFISSCNQNLWRGIMIIYDNIWFINNGYIVHRIMVPSASISNYSNGTDGIGSWHVLCWRTCWRTETISRIRWHQGHRWVPKMDQNLRDLRGIMIEGHPYRNTLLQSCNRAKLYWISVTCQHWTLEVVLINSSNVPVCVKGHWKARTYN